jgi:hypothetical protein
VARRHRGCPASLFRPQVLGLNRAGGGPIEPATQLPVTLSHEPDFLMQGHQHTSSGGAVRS